ncbi:hypothetical protein DL768_009054 [Monosporascus sp. mg162]|nr:hypothetical protein DL768_009054 [Monosporascus sp. mg162]
MSSRSSGNSNSLRNGSGRSSPWNSESTRTAASSLSSAEAVLEFKVQPPPTVIRNRRTPYAIIVGLTPPRRDSNCFVQLFLHNSAGFAVGEVRDGSASEKTLQNIGVGCYIFPNLKLNAPVEDWYYLRASFRVATGDGSTEMYSVSSGLFLLAPGEPHDPDEREFYRRVAARGYRVRRLAVMEASGIFQLPYRINPYPTW